MTDMRLVFSKSSRLLLHVVLGATLCVGAAAQTIGRVEESCWAATKREFKHNVVQMWKGVEAVPAGAVRSENLKWEIPVAAATGVLIGAVDWPAANRARSEDVASATDTASDIVIGTQIGAAFLTYGVGCAASKPKARSVGLTSLSGLGFSIGTDLLLKAAFNREYPDKFNGHGRFWAGGKSFPSGHAASAWGLASAFASTNPRRRWLNWSMYAAAASVGMLRFPARKHFPSDILIGATLGYVAGRWTGEHRAEPVEVIERISD